MPTADGNVTFIATDLDLLSFSHRDTVGIDSQNHCRLASAVTDGLDLCQSICPGQQMLTSFEEISLKIGPQAIGQYRNIEVIANIAELSYLTLGEKPR
jgi:hypothetical protein